MTTMRDFLYAQAITLNNIGVHLLHIGAAKQGLETLRDAIDTFRTACHPNAAGDDPLVKQEILNKTWEKVKRASSKALNPVCSGKLKPVELVCWEDLDLSSTRSLSTAAPVPTDECHIVFSMSTVCSIEHRDHELDSCIMLANYGLAHLSLMNNSNAPQVNKTALSLFRMSFTVLYRKIQEGIEDEIWGIEAPVESITGLTIAVLRNLIHTLLFEGLETESEACQSKLSEIVEALSMVEDIHSTYMLPLTAAAAA